MSLHAPDVSITDFLIALLCVYFCVQLVLVKAMHHDLRKLFVGLFVSTAIAAGAGGAYHGFLEAEPTKWSTVVWKLTLLAIGCTAFYLWHIGAYFGLPQNWRRWVSALLQFGILIYALYVGYVSQSFAVAIVAYSPAVLFFLGVVVVRFFKTKDSRMILAMIGLLLTILAAVVQTQRIALHPEYFNHNALYHLIQAFGLYALFRFAVRVVVWN